MISYFVISEILFIYFYFFFTFLSRFHSGSSSSVAYLYLSAHTHIHIHIIKLMCSLVQALKFLFLYPLQTFRSYYTHTEEFLKATALK